MRNKKLAAIIVAGGFGKRMACKIPKPFIKIVGKPLLTYSLDMFEKSSLIDSIVLVVAEEFLGKAEKIIRRKNYKKLKKIVKGGATRARSVYNGLCATDKDCDFVLIHDAARPLICRDIIERCAFLMRKGINCIAAVPVKGTIKKIDLKNKYILETPRRKALYEAQTPQALNKNVLLKAYKKLGAAAWGFKDDASLIEACGVRVKVVNGDYSNIKITTKEDLKIAEALLRKA